MSTQTSGSEGSIGTPPAVAHLMNPGSVTGVSKSTMNRMIMDYLVKHGYSQAATDFAMESGVNLGVDLTTIEQRKRIKNAIYCGQLQVAIEEINEIDATILEQDQNLHFQLLNLQLVEIIKEETAKEHLDIHRCANFAQENLAPQAPTNPIWKDQLEKTMSLLIFDHNQLIPELSAVISPQKRLQVAEAANEAILRVTGESPVAGLNELLQTRVFAEAEARNLSRWPAGGVGLDIGLDGNPSNGGAHAEDELMAG